MNSCGNTRIQCNCCEKLVCCKVCHLKQNTNCSFEGEQVIIECSNCKKYLTITHNEDNLMCSSCNYNIGYICMICKVLFPFSDEFEYYHCEKCGMCICKTKGILFEHCNKCGMDMPVDHKCYGIDKCLICFQYWKEDSKKEVIVSRCSHIFHKNCISTAKVCPIDRSTFGKVKENEIRLFISKLLSNMDRRLALFLFRKVFNTETISFFLIFGGVVLTILGIELHQDGDVPIFGGVAPANLLFDFYDDF